MTSLLIIGSGRHGRIVAEAASQSGQFALLGFGDDDPVKFGTEIDDWRVLGDWRTLSPEAWVVAIGKNPAREAIFRILAASGKTIATVLSPRAFVSPKAEIGAGTVVLAGAIVQAGARIGRNCIVNAGAVIDHDAVLEDHSHAGLNSTVASHARVQEGEFLAHGAVRLRE